MTNTEKYYQAIVKRDEAWQTWNEFHAACREALVAATNAPNFTYGETLCWEKYEATCKKRDDAYVKAIDADEDVWRTKNWVDKYGA